MLESLQPILQYFKAEYVVSAGYLLMTIVVFVETGLLIGFCLPGDSLLVTAGLFAARGDLDLLTINLLLVPAAILGDTVGYWIGYHSGPRLFKRPKSLLFNPEHLRHSQEFYERHGGKVVILARFMPIVRTFAPVVAGMGKMAYGRFLAYNVIGGFLWVTGLTCLSYALGAAYPKVFEKLEVIIMAVILVSVSPALIPLFKAWRARRRAGAGGEIPGEPAAPQPMSEAVGPEVV